MEITILRAFKVWWSFMWRTYVLMLPVMAALMPLLLLIAPKKGEAGAAQVPSIVLMISIWTLMMVGMLFMQTLALRWALKTKWSDFRLQVASPEGNIESMEMPPAKIHSVTNPKNKKAILILVGAFIAVVAVTAVIASRHPISRLFTVPADRNFVENGLKTSVALVELYKIRFGKYPKYLSEIDFQGPWDLEYLNRINYKTNKDQTKYYVESEECNLDTDIKSEFPPEFWHGTGYDPTLK